MCKITLTQSLFYNNVLNISCNLLNTALKVKNRMVVWVLIHNIQLKAHWHIDGHFADMMGCENTLSKNHWQHNTLQTELLTPVITWLTGRCGYVPLPSVTGSVLLHITSPGKRSKFEVRFLQNARCFYTVVMSKHLKWNHC